VLVAQACNPSYSGDRDQEDHCLKPSWTNSLSDPVSKTPITKRGWWLKMQALSLNSNTAKKKKKKELPT
jgi:hypothetical protein